MTYTPADPYTPFFPTSTTQKPDNIIDGQDIVFQHVGPLWDEVIRTQNVLLGNTGSVISLTTSATGSVPLTVRGLSGQTADLFRARIGTTDLFRVGPSGQITVAGAATIDGATTIKNDITTTAATNLVSNFLNLSDANPTFRINKNGFMSWGVGGITATDTTLYRTGAGFLRTDGDLVVGSNAVQFSGTGVRLDNSGVLDVGRATPDSSGAITISGNGESNARFAVTGQGTINWSSGSSTPDASLTRSGAGALSLTGSLAISSALTVAGKTPVYTDNAALTDTRLPTGPASGDLTGSYPAPTIKSDVSLPGAPTTTTASTSDNSTKIATTAYVKNQGYATLASPTFTGTPLAPTAAVDTNSSQIASTAFVLAQASSTIPTNVTSVAAVGVSTRFARADHAHAIPTNGITALELSSDAGSDLGRAVTTNHIRDNAVTYSKIDSSAWLYQASVNVTTSGGSARIFQLDDARQKFIEYNSASAGTFTVPADGTTNFPVGSEIHVLQTNTGQLTIAPAATVTVNGTPGLKLRTQWSSATLIKRAANTWLVVGDLVA